MRRSLGRAAMALLLGAVLLSGEQASAGDAAPATPGFVISRPFAFSYEPLPEGRHMGVRLRGTVELRPLKVDGIDMVELSGLAWDDDDELLYAVSDNGALFALRPSFADGELQEVRAVAAHPLRAHDGSRLRGASADSEGLAIEHGRDGRAGNATLVVSFEREPRLHRLSRDGVLQTSLPLAASLRDIKRYRSANKALESVTFLPQLGWLTAPEWPLKGESTVRIANADGWQGTYPLYPAPGCALVAMEALPDQGLLTLERCFHRPSATLTVALRRVAAADALTSSNARAGQLPALAPADVAIFDSRGEFAVDNFEGLTRHRGQRFFMVSDDNQNFLQRTLLVYFELVP